MGIEVGDTVFWKGLKVEVFGIDSNEISCAIEWRNNGTVNTDIAFVDDLSVVKKPSELDEGDRFKLQTGQKYKVLAVAYDDYHEQKIYFVKCIEGYAKGSCITVISSGVEEVIYN